MPRLGGRLHSHLQARPACDLDPLSTCFSRFLLFLVTSLLGAGILSAACKQWLWPPRSRSHPVTGAQVLPGCPSAAAACCSEALLLHPDLVCRWSLSVCWCRLRGRSLCARGSWGGHAERFAGPGVISAEECSVPRAHLTNTPLSASSAPAWCWTVGTMSRAFPHGVRRP